MQKNNVEKDVCEFYEVSQKQYNIAMSGIGITDELKKYGIEINKTKLNNYRAKRKMRRKNE